MQRHGGNISAGHWMKKPTEKATLRLHLPDVQEKVRPWWQWIEQWLPGAGGGLGRNEQVQQGGFSGQ